MKNAKGSCMAVGRFSVVVSLAIGLSGCGMFGAKEKDVRFSEAKGLTQLRSVPAGGDFALYFEGAEKPEVPVRVNSGDSVGFVREEDGRLKAVAGPFRMDISDSVHEASWKRLNYTDE